MPVFILSSELFQGYRVEIHPDDLVDLDTICRDVKSRLLNDLQNLRLENLVALLEKTSFHVHDYTLIDVLDDRTGRSWYLCDHCPSSAG